MFVQKIKILSFFLFLFTIFFILGMMGVSSLVNLSTVNELSQVGEIKKWKFLFRFVLALRGRDNEFLYPMSHFKKTLRL